MSTTVQIYSNRAYSYNYLDSKWLDAKNAIDADAVDPGNPSAVGIISGYRFFRIYLSFDLSTKIIPAGSIIDSITISLRRSDRIRSPYSPTVAYAGNNILDGSRREYPLYLDNIIGTSDLAIINITDDLGYYTSKSFDLTTYSMITPGSTLTLGIIDSLDFNDSVDSISDTYLIDTDTEGSYPPYIDVTYRDAGYPNSIMGVASANIADVSGIPTANILSVMGV
jgi:hypothetical protein